MKEKIHPKYYQATILCAGCNTTFTAGSTVQNIRVDICSNCHPFYTGQKKLIDTEGRVERFERRLAQRQEADRKPKKVVATAPASKSASSTAEQPKVDANRPKSLREMLQDAANNARS
jgi:large subunit ribosomal protein L31